MIKQKIDQNTYYLGFNDTETDLFEALWPLDQGVTYNAYLIKDTKNALIDTVEAKFTDEFIKQVKEILGDEKLDYLIINHMEPDHSSALPQLKELYPNLKIIGNKKTASFVKGFYHLPKSTVQVVKSGDELDLGQHQLQFEQAPMVHWPESMMTYDQATQILFSNDIFGGFKTVGDKIFADEQADLAEFRSEARRYFSNIIGAYTRPAQRAIKITDELDIKMVAPAHGLVWKESPDQIIDWYRAWANFEAEPGVTIIYGSMYGHTKKIAQAVADNLKANGVKKINLLDAARTHTSELINSFWQLKGLVIGSSTYTNDIFPPIKTFISALEERRVQNRFLGLFGSYSWTGGALKGLKKFADDSRLDLVEPSFRTDYGQLNEEIKEKVNQLAKNMAEKITA